MRKTFEVFISSTYRDLSHVRKVVCDSIERIAILNTVNMENFGANPSQPLDYCIKMVKRSDLYVGIFASYRGAEIETERGVLKSITELEYDEAVNSKIPIFAAVDHADVSGDAPQTKELERQSAFKTKVLANHVVVVGIDNPEKLALRLVASIMNHLIEERILSFEEDHSERWNTREDRERLIQAINDLDFLEASEKEKIIIARNSQLAGQIIQSVESNQAAGIIAGSVARKLIADLLYHVDKPESLRRYKDMVGHGEAGAFEYNRIGMLHSILTSSADALAAYNIAYTISTKDDLTRLTIRCNRASELLDANLERGVVEIDELLEDENLLKEVGLWGRALTLKAMSLMRSDEFASSITYSKRAMEEELSQQNTSEAAHDANNIVMAMLLNKNIREADSAVHEAIRLNTEAARVKGLGIAYFHRVQWKLLKNGEGTEWLSDLKLAQSYLLEAGELRKLSDTYAFLARRVVDRDPVKSAALFERAARTLRSTGRSKELVEYLFLAATCFTVANDRKNAARVTDDLLKVLGDERLWVLPELDWVRLLISAMSDRERVSFSRVRHVLRRIANSARKSGSKVFGEELAIISTEYLMRGEHEQALSVDREIFEFAEFRSEFARSQWLGNFGSNLVVAKKFDEGRELLLKANELYIRQGDKRALANNYSNLTSACLGLLEFEDARTFHRLAVQFERDLGNFDLTELDRKHGEILDSIWKVESTLGPEFQSFLEEFKRNR
jgi:tetratricopeptide (TPR) repeat protein